MDFVSEVLPVVQRVAKRWFWADEEREAICIAYSWHLWTHYGPRVAPGWIATVARRHVATGRDLPGLGQQKGGRDVFRRKAGILAEYFVSPSKEPDPVRNAIAREQVAKMYADASDWEKEVLDGLYSGETPSQVAERTGNKFWRVYEAIRRMRRRLRK